MADVDVERERPLSVEIRASMFIKIYTPAVEKMFVPLALDSCDAFQPRKGAFAALGRCAKCNFREEEHHNFPGRQETAPKWVKRAIDQPGTKPEPLVTHKWTANVPMTTPERITPVVTHTPALVTNSRSTTEVPFLRSASAGFIENTSSDTAFTRPRTLIKSASSASLSSVSSKRKHGSEVLSVVNGERPRAAVTLGTDVDDVEEARPKSEDGVNVDEMVDDDMDDDDDGKPVRRPSWAPPPLIDVDSDDSLSPNTSPANAAVSPSKKVMRRMSWLSPRAASSSVSDGSASPMGPKRASLRLLATQIRAKMTKAKDTWETKIGDALPTCNRCGRPIEPQHKIFSAGMARAHEVCPSKEESERGPRNPRYMVQKAQDRIVLTFRCDKETKQPYTFIYDLDQNTKQQALRMRNNEEMILAYVADASSHATLERRFKTPRAREFDASVRYTHNFTFENPITHQVVSPELDLRGKRVTVTKFCCANAVVHKLTAAFGYDEDTHVLSPISLTFSFSQMPGTQPRLATFINRDGLAKRVEEKIRAAAAEKEAATSAVTENGTPAVSH